LPDRATNLLEDEVRRKLRIPKLLSSAPHLSLSENQIRAFGGVGHRESVEVGCALLLNRGWFDTRVSHAFGGIAIKADN
jgi:hypothetical protein